MKHPYWYEKAILIPIGVIFLMITKAVGAWDSLTDWKREGRI